MSDVIVALRELFTDPTQDERWNEAFCEQLQKAQYQRIWLHGQQTCSFLPRVICSWVSAVVQL